MKHEVFISTNGCGGLVAEYGDIKLDLEDCGLAKSFCYGDSVEIAYEPSDCWELMSLLER